GARPFVSGDERIVHESVRPGAVEHLPVATADPGGVHADQRFAVPGRAGRMRHDPEFARTVDDELVLTGVHRRPRGSRFSQPSAHKSKCACCCGNSAAASVSNSTPRPGRSLRSKYPSTTRGAPDTTFPISESAKSLKCSRILKFGVQKPTCNVAAVSTDPPTLWGATSM